MNLVSREKAIDVAIDEYNRGYKEGFEAGKSSVSGDGDLISRQAAFEALCNATFGCADIDVCKKGDRYCAEGAKLDEVPSAQPEQKCETCRYRNLEWSEEPCDSCTMYGKDCHYKPERKKGKWVKGGNQPYFRKHFDIVVCSNCNKRGERRFNYCPNCGSYNGGDKE